MGWTLVWIGLGWTNFFRLFHGPGLDGQIFGWAGRTGLLFEATTMDWTGLLDLILRMGLGFRRTQERQKCKQNVQICLFSRQTSYVSIIYINSVPFNC